MEFHTDGLKVYSWVTIPGHLCGWENLAHGGVLSTILDETMGWCAMHLLKRITLTKAMEVRFLKPVRVQDPLMAEANIVDVRNDREVMVEGSITNGQGETTTTASALFALFTPEALRRLGIFDEDTVRNAESIIMVG